MLLRGERGGAVEGGVVLNVMTVIITSPSSRSVPPSLTLQNKLKPTMKLYVRLWCIMWTYDENKQYGIKLK